MIMHVFYVKIVWITRGLALHECSNEEHYEILFVEFIILRIFYIFPPPSPPIPEIITSFISFWMIEDETINE